ncbi:hypothetical protein HA466_0240900 [Hirschfeldia incana]|nr:hypothetical protein HA466_0240900 [Hirschfeldia incana]
MFSMASMCPTASLPRDTRQLFQLLENRIFGSNEDSSSVSLHIHRHRILQSLPESSFTSSDASIKPSIIFRL